MAQSSIGTLPRRQDGERLGSEDTRDPQPVLALGQRGMKTSYILYLKYVALSSDRQSSGQCEQNPQFLAPGL
jgi:hypothetical protein